VGKVDDIEHAENHGKAKAQHGVEGSIDEAEEELREKDRRRLAEDFKHGVTSIRLEGRAGPIPARPSDQLIS
jgi:hypothetical protein